MVREKWETCILMPTDVCLDETMLLSAAHADPFCVPMHDKPGGKYGNKYFTLAVCISRAYCYSFELYDPRQKFQVADLVKKMTNRLPNDGRIRRIWADKFYTNLASVLGVINTPHDFAGYLNKKYYSALKKQHFDAPVTRRAADIKVGACDGSNPIVAQVSHKDPVSKEVIKVVGLYFCNNKRTKSRTQLFMTTSNYPKTVNVCNKRTGAIEQKVDLLQMYSKNKGHVDYFNQELRSLEYPFRKDGRIPKITFLLNGLVVNTMALHQSLHPTMNPKTTSQVAEEIARTISPDIDSRKHTRITTITQVL